MASILYLAYGVVKCNVAERKGKREIAGRIHLALSVRLKEKVARCCFQATPFGREIR